MFILKTLIPRSALWVTYKSFLLSIAIARGAISSPGPNPVLQTRYMNLKSLSKTIIAALQGVGYVDIALSIDRHPGSDVKFAGSAAGEPQDASLPSGVSL